VQISSLEFKPLIEDGASKPESFAQTSGIKRGDAMEWCSTGVPAQLRTTNDICKDELLTTDVPGGNYNETSNRSFVRL